MDLEDDFKIVQIIFSTFLLVILKHFILLNSECTMKKKLEDNLNIIPISPSQFKIKLHTENQPPSLLNSGEIAMKNWKTTLKYFQFVPQYFSPSQVKIKLHTENQPPSLVYFGVMKKTLKLGIGRRLHIFSIFSSHFS